MTDRRKFLQGLTVAAGAATVLRPHVVSAAAEPGLETTRLRLVQRSVICSAPIYVTEALLRDEGFLAQGTDWRFLNELKKELKG
jgi:hypothetical protein